jgi:hypothetical protein
MMSFVRTGEVDPIAAAVTGGAGVTSGSTTVYTHVPPRSNANGSANFSSDRSLLETEVDVFTYVHVPKTKEVYYVHPIRRSLVMFQVDSTNDKSYILHYRLSMLSGILGVPNGSDQQTGELLIGYPSTLVGTDVATETGRMKLRMYLGAVLYKRENVMILPDIAFNGVINFGVYEEEVSLPGASGTPAVAVADKFEPTIANAKGAAIRSKFVGGTRPAKLKEVAAINGADTPSLNDANVTKVLQDSRPFIYQAATFKPGTSGDFVQATANNGHLGCIDSPACIDRLYGVNAYSATPTPFAVGKA